MNKYLFEKIFVDFIVSCKDGAGAAITQCFLRAIAPTTESIRRWDNAIAIFSDSRLVCGEGQPYTTIELIGRDACDSALTQRLMVKFYTKVAEKHNWSE